MSNIDLKQLADSQKANTEVMMALVRSAFSSMEKLTTLNLAATREFFDSGVSSTQKLMSIKDPQELSRINSSLAQPNVDKMLAYSRSIYDLAAGLQKEITSVMETQYSSLTKKASSVIEKGSSTAPVGGDVFGAAMQQMLQASTTAYDNMSQMAKQMAEITNANVKTAASTPKAAPVAKAVAPKAVVAAPAPKAAPAPTAAAAPQAVAPAPKAAPAATAAPAPKTAVAPKAAPAPKKAVPAPKAVAAPVAKKP